MNRPIQIEINDLFSVIGELEVMKRKQGAQLEQLYTQINEMQAEIEKLRAKRSRKKRVEEKEG